MKRRNRVPAIVVIVLGAFLTACAGGGSSGSPAALSRVAQPGASPVAPAAVTAYGTITIRIPPKTPAGSGIREVAYVSPGTTRAAVFIDGAASPAGSTTTCTATVSSGAGCSLTWAAAVSVPAAHMFAVEIDDGTTVLAENQAEYALVFGNNGALAVLTLKGVASAGALSGESCATTSCSGTLTLEDAAANPIVNTTSPLAPGFDNGPLAVASTDTGVGTVSAGGTITQPSAAGTSAYTVTCIASTGTFLTSLTPSSATGSGDITSAELTGRGLVYPASITYESNAYRCAAGATISEVLLYVAMNDAAGTLRIYATGANGAATPLATIGGTNTAMNAPHGVALDSSGRIYVANAGYGVNTVTVYASNPRGTLNETPLATIGGTNTGLLVPQGVALDSSGRIYVANNDGNSVTVYASNPSGTVNVAPLATIGGGSTGMNHPVAVALDSSGRIYVANASASNVLVFASNPSGNVTSAPYATIGGNSTAINNPNGVALDSSGRIYVANYSANTVTMYASNPSGTLNEAPLATIGGGSTGIAYPAGVALDPSGQIYVSNNGNSTVTVYAANPSGSVTTAPLRTITGIPSSWGLAIY